MNPPPPPLFGDPCVECGKKYVESNWMGKIACLNNGVSCSRGHVWCRDCREKRYEEDWENFCPLLMKNKKDKRYKERRFDF